MKDGIFENVFVNRIPQQLENGKLYICLECNVVVHLCACGCEEKVVLPISPQFWKLHYDGEGVTLSPSVGNFSFPCHSHYFIRNSRVQWVVDFKEKPADQTQLTRKGKRKKWNPFWKGKH